MSCLADISAVGRNPSNVAVQSGKQRVDAEEREQHKSHPERGAPEEDAVRALAARAVQQRASVAFG